MNAQFPPQSLPRRGRGRQVLVVVVVWLVVAILAGVLVFQRLGGGDADDLGTGEVFLAPAAAVGPEPFVEAPQSAGSPPPVLVATPTPAPGQPAGGLKSVVGTSPGLYGGVQDVASCDVSGLADRLESDGAKGAAWARAAGIAAGQIRQYLGRLTSAVLRADTRVTAYRYVGDRAVARQAVLQAGTHVLVDAYGSPAVRCVSGSPLQPPEPARSGAAYTGEAWAGFRPERAMVVVRAPAPVGDLVLVDIAGSGYFTRPVGGSNAGPPRDGAVFVDTVCDLYPEICDPPGLRPPDPIAGPGGDTVGIRFELRWFSTADLDLAVTDPAGTTVRYDSPTTANGGRLNADTNGACRAPTSSPAEIITWPAPAQPGDYLVTITYYAACPGGEGPQAYELVADGPEVTALGVARIALAAVGLPELGVGAMALGAQTSTGKLESPGQTATISFRAGDTFTLPKVPGPVLNLSASIDDEGAVVFTWDPNLDPSYGSVTSFSVLATAVIDGEERATELTLPATTNGLRHPGLPPGITVSFIVVAENPGGLSEPMSVSITTPEAPPPTPMPTPPPVEDRLRQYCNAMYPPEPLPGEEATNPMWTLCMHDPTSDEVVDQPPIPVP